MAGALTLGVRGQSLILPQNRSRTPCSGRPAQRGGPRSQGETTVRPVPPRSCKGQRLFRGAVLMFPRLPRWAVAWRWRPPQGHGDMRTEWLRRREQSGGVRTSRSHACPSASLPGRGNGPSVGAQLPERLRRPQTLLQRDSALRPHRDRQPTRGQPPPHCHGPRVTREDRRLFYLREPGRKHLI